MRVSRLSLLAVCIFAVVLSAQSAPDLQRIDDMRDWLKAIEPQLSPTGVTNARNIATRLNTLKGQFKPAQPIDAVMSDWTLDPADVSVSPCVNGTQTRTETWRRTVLQPAQNGGATGALEDVRTADVACTPPPPVVSTLTRLSLSPATVVGGGTVAGVVSLSGPAPADRVVTLTSSRPVMAPVPTSVTVLAGQASVSFDIVTPPSVETSDRTATVTATLAGVNQTASVVIKPTAGTPPPPPPVEICGNGIDDDGDGQIDEGCSTTPPPPPPGTHGYFDQLCARPDKLACYSLRDPAQLQTPLNGGYAHSNSRPLVVVYDAQADAAKVTIGTGSNSLTNQVRVPIPKHAPDSMFATWDAYFGPEWAYNISGIPDMKTFQFGSPFHDIHMEVRNRFQLSGSSVAGLIDGRLYPEGGYSQGPNVTFADTLTPRVGTFRVPFSRWVRFWAYFEAPSVDQWYRYSLWASDGTSGAVLIYDRLQVRPSPQSTSASWESFWLEYNTSTAAVKAGRAPLIAYARNVAVLKGVTASQVSALLIRP